MEEDVLLEESKDEGKQLSPTSGHVRTRSEDDDCSPERKTKTKLKIGNKDIQKLENEVKSVIRRTKTSV